MNHRSAATAAVLSFLFPGLGHAYLGRRHAALVFALPAILVALAAGLDLLRGIDGIIAYVITPSGAMTVLVLVLLTGAWRLVSMIDAIAVARRVAGLRARATMVAGVLVAITLVTHGSAAYVAYTMYDASSRIFVAGGPDDGASAPPPDPGESGMPSPSELDDYQVAPEVTPPTVASRINILLTGIDSAETRTTALTDTIMVVSINPADKSVAMVSIPRDISNFRLYDGRTFKGKINSFMTWVRNHPSEFDEKPFPALMKEVGYLLGVPIHYFAAIDLQGFRRMIDEVGGVTVDNPRAINDPLYDWFDGSYGFYLDAGRVKLNGRNALAYARSRQGAGDSDFTRAARQQQLLVALRQKLTSASMITRLPDIIKVAGDTVRTNVPTDRLEELIKLAREIDGDLIERVVLGPPYAYHPPTSSTGGVYTLQLRMDKLAKLSRTLFGADSRYAGE
ncbi:MAG: LCP family protein [Chloroflexota bacterium]